MQRLEALAEIARSASSAHSSAHSSHSSSEHSSVHNSNGKRSVEDVDDFHEARQHNTAPKSVDTSKLVRRVHRHLCSAAPHECLAVASHRRAVECIHALHVSLLDGAEIADGSQQILKCVGVALVRRVFSEVESKDVSGYLKTTLSLLFALLLLNSVKASDNDDDDDQDHQDDDQVPVADGGGGGVATVANNNAEAGSSRDPVDVNMDDTVDEAEDEEEAAASLVRQFEHASIADCMYKTNAVLLSDVDGIRGGDVDGDDSNDVDMSAEATCAALVVHTRANTGNIDAGALESAAIVYFRCYARSVVEKLFDAAVSTVNAGDFLTLGSATFLSSVNDASAERLQSLADGAESEAGQAIMRDLILSFTLPRNVVGVRRTLLLSRESNAVATKQYAEVLNEAHEAALRGASYVWQNDANELFKACTILAGIAMLLLPTGQNQMRKATAFNGAVDLPFLEVPPPDAGRRRLTFLDNSNTWVVFEIDTKTSVPKVLLRATGFEGLQKASLLFVDGLNK